MAWATLCALQSSKAHAKSIPMCVKYGASCETRVTWEAGHKMGRLNVDQRHEHILKWGC